MSESVKGKFLCAALEKVWFAVADMITDMRNRGIDVPHHVSVALQGARVMINLCKYHPNLESHIEPSTLDAVQGFCVACCGADIVARIECELRNIEDLMVVKAFNTLGEEYAGQWQSRIGECWKEVGKLSG